MNDRGPVSVPVAYGLMGFTIFIWGSAFAGIRYLLRELDPLTFTSLRLTIGVGGMLVGALLARTRLPEREDLLRITAAGLLGFTLYHLALNFGTNWVTAGQASFVTSTIPVWTAMLAFFFLDEKIAGRHWIGLAVSLAGVGVMSLDTTDIEVPLGSALVLLAAMCAGGNIVLQKGLLDRYRPTDLTVYVTVIGSLPLIVYLPFQIDAVSNLSTTAWWVALYLGLGPIALGYWLSTIALRTLPASRTSQMLLFIPLIASVIAWFAIGEEPGPRLYAGGALILAGVALSMRRSGKTPVQL